VSQERSAAPVEVQAPDDLAETIRALLKRLLLPEDLEKLAEDITPATKAMVEWLPPAKRSAAALICANLIRTAFNGKSRQSVHAMAVLMDRLDGPVVQRVEEKTERLVRFEFAEKPPERNQLAAAQDEDEAAPS
jgi:hypothetical protein